MGNFLVVGAIVGGGIISSRWECITMWVEPEFSVFTLVSKERHRHSYRNKEKQMTVRHVIMKTM